MFRVSRKAVTRLLTAAVIAVLALTTALMSGGGSATAAPADVKYKVTKTDDKVLLSVTDGSITHDGNLVSIRNSAGKALWSMPLTYSLENTQFPIDMVKYSSNRVALIPIKDPGRGTPADPVQVGLTRDIVRKHYANDGYQTKKERDDAALKRFNSEVAAGMTITSIIFTAIGAVLGGFLIGAPSCAAVVFCLPGLVTGAAVGGIAGTILGGSGSVVVAGIRYFQTITSPFTPPRKKKN